VIPVYTEEKNVEELHEKLIKVLSSLKKKYEIIFVDDGSTDNTFENLLTSMSKSSNSGKTLEKLLPYP
jgi:glycosyltransferase involved in cell wall biosynthesis